MGAMRQSKPDFARSLSRRAEKVVSGIYHAYKSGQASHKALPRSGRSENPRGNVAPRVLPIKRDREHVTILTAPAFRELENSLEREPEPMTTLVKARLNGQQLPHH
jgi:hypothetical protein